MATLNVRLDDKLKNEAYAVLEKLNITPTEAVRLLFWATQAIGKPLSSLNREDLLAYEAFLANPSAEWIDTSMPRRGSKRRLLDGPLSPRSIAQAMGILSGLFGYLVEAGYLLLPQTTFYPQSLPTFCPCSQSSR